MDQAYIRAIVRMFISGWNYVALMHILTNFRGVPVVDFIDTFIMVAERDFMLDEGFIPMFENIKTVDDLLWLADYREASKTRSWR